MNRRKFLKRSTVTAVSAVTLPGLIAGTALGRYAPSNRITVGCIGLGGMGTNNMIAFLNQPDTQVLAVCDPETGSNQYNHWYNRGGWLGREPARQRVDEFYADRKQKGSFKGCDGYVDFHDVIARDDIDAVMIAPPDHWHAIPTIQAAKSGKHIYCEKPLSLTVAEGRAMADAVARYAVVFQTGTHHRSVDEHLPYVCELVRNERIGRLKRIVSHIGPNNRTSAASGWSPMPIPKGFDYDMWLGPAPWRPYHRDRCHYTFRFLRDYSGGQTTNLGVHALDICQWANGTDLTGPVEIENIDGQFPRDGLFTTATNVHFRARYANGVELICKTDTDGIVARIEGTEGWIETTYKSFRTYPASLKDSVIGPDEIHLYRNPSHDHKRNFLDCIKSRQETIAPVEVGHRSTTLCHLGNIAMLLRRRIRWNPDTEQVIGDDEAARMLHKPYRAPWQF